VNPSRGAPIVRDGLLPPQLLSQLADALAWVPMYFQRRADSDPRAQRLDGYFFYPLATVADKHKDDAEPRLAELDASLRPVQQVWDIVRTEMGDVRLYECEFTANPYGTEGHAHHDCLTAERRGQHATAIVYCNTEWDLSWAGETVLFDAHGDIAHAVLPRPGRIAIFRDDPLHAARGVSRACPMPRRVLVFKMWQKAEQDTPRSRDDGPRVSAGAGRSHARRAPG
jgi:SM-20-related protein